MSVPYTEHIVGLMLVSCGLWYLQRPCTRTLSRTQGRCHITRKETQVEHSQSSEQNERIDSQPLTQEVISTNKFGQRGGIERPLREHHCRNAPEHHADDWTNTTEGLTQFIVPAFPHVGGSRNQWVRACVPRPLNAPHTVRLYS